MGKTIRRKNFNDIWLWYKTEEEFNSARENCLHDHTEYHEMKARIDAAMIEMKKEVDKRRFSGENVYLSDILRERGLYLYDKGFYHRFRDAEKFIKEVGNTENTYKQYVKRKKAIMHSDAGYGYWGITAPRWYRNLYYERPMRRNVKKQLKNAVAYDTFDETVYDDCYKGAAWSYW